MKSPKFQVGETVQTTNPVETRSRVSGVIKYRFYGAKFNGWYYVVRPSYAGTEEGIVHSERILELSPPIEVIHCYCCCPNKPNRKAYPLSFHKDQRVRAIKNGVVYFGKINCVIDMKTYYDYYVDVCGHLTMAMDCDSTIRCNEKELCSCSCCCCQCYCC